MKRERMARCAPVVSPLDRNSGVARSRTSLFVLSVAMLPVVFGCDWGRFNRVKEDAPVVRLEPSDDYRGRFADHLAVAHKGDRVELYAGGAARAEGGLTYSLGSDDNPQPNPTDESQCPGADGANFCDTLERPTGLNESWTPADDVQELCFVTGFGNVGDDEGLWTRCDDGYQFAFPVPDDVRAPLGAKPDEDSPARGLVVASNAEGDQVLLAAASSLNRAWFYEPLSADPIDLPTPEGAGDDFGKMVAVGALEGGHLLAVAAPKAGQVWLFKRQGATAEAIGCLRGEEGFGATMSVGRVDQDDQEELVVGGTGSAEVFSGDVLDSLSGGASLTECDPDALSDDPALFELTCENTDETKGCSVSEFGAALAVADVDGDGAGEIFVGAPRMEAREHSRAGAVLAYDQEGDFLDVLLVSDGKEGDLLGSSLAALPQGERQIVGAGAPGSRELYLFYCAAGSDGKGSARCE